MNLASGNENTITFEDIKDLRKTKDDLKRHKVFKFYQDIVPCLIGRREWEMKRAISTISEIVPTSLEAMALWIIDNYVDKWSRKGRRTEKAKYTCITQGNKLFGGWNESGIERFNNLICMVRRNRSEDAQFEKEFLAYCQEEEECREEQKLEEPPENNISCLDDLDDDDSSRGQGIAETTTTRQFEIQVPSVVNVSKSFVGQYNVPSPELSVASGSSSHVGRPVASPHGDSGRRNGLYGNFGYTDDNNIHNRASV